MEEELLSGLNTWDEGSFRTLNPGIIQAVCRHISGSNGKPSWDGGGFPDTEDNPPKTDPSQLAMALAYANLCLDEPEMVTSRHLQMLRKNFSFQEIQELNALIKKMIE